MASTSKVVAKKTLKRKNDGKEDRLLKRGTGTPINDKQLKLLSPSKPCHRVGKGLMIGRGLIAKGLVHRLLMHKDYVVETIDLIIKETDLDPCADQTTEDLGESGLFDLPRVCFPQTFVLTYYLFTLLLTVVWILGASAHESASGQVRRLRRSDPSVSKALRDREQGAGAAQGVSTYPQ